MILILFCIVLQDPHKYCISIFFLQILSVEDPPVRQAGAKVADVDELVAKLKEKGF